jgi:hypothetical protein
MKKIVSMLCVCVLSLSLFGCSKPENNVELKKNVSCQLLDVLTITNDTDNSTYYYYLASVENKGKKPYDTKNLIYTVTDDNEKDISVIDKYQSTPSYIINKGQNTYIYGYIGFPNNDQKNLGLSFNNKKQFLPFKAFDIRKASDKNVKDSKDTKYTFFEDDTLQIGVDASKASYVYENGETILKNIKITYKNKTDSRIIVPYLTPSATLEGVDLSNKYDFANMDEIKSHDFTTNGMAPKTQSFKADVTGYVLYFLDKKQTVNTEIEFHFEKAAPDFTDKSTKPFVVHMNSKAFGKSNTFKIGLE